MRLWGWGCALAACLHHCLERRPYARLHTMAPPSCGHGFEPSGVQVCMRVHV